MSERLTPEQRQVIRELKAAPSWKRAGKRARKALLEAGGVESNFSTPDQAHSDADSEGALQQRPSQGWGPTSESNTKDAEQFLQRAIPLERKYKSSGELAQAVQRSAFPDRYNQRSGQAERLLGGDTGPRGLGQTRGTGKLDPGTPVTVTPGSTTVDYDSALIDSLLDRHRTAGSILKSMQDRVAGGGYTTTTEPVITDGKLASFREGRRSAASGTRANAEPATGGTGKFKITGPNPDRIQPKVKSFLRDLGGVAGETIVGSDGTGHSKMTASGNVSEHFTGAATDIAASGSHLTRLGQDALVAAGWSQARARKAKGGIYNVTHKGHRYQIIFNTNEGGNHWNHLHVGVR